MQATQEDALSSMAIISTSTLAQIMPGRAIRSQYVRIKVCQLSVNGWCVMLFSTLRIVRGGAQWPPLEKPTRTYPTGVKITGGLELDNLSTKMQFQVN